MRTMRTYRLYLENFGDKNLSLSDMLKNPDPVSASECESNKRMHRLPVFTIWQKLEGTVPSIMSRPKIDLIINSNALDSEEVNHLLDQVDEAGLDIIGLSFWGVYTDGLIDDELNDDEYLSQQAMGAFISQFIKRPHLLDCLEVLSFIETNEHQTAIAKAILDVKNNVTKVNFNFSYARQEPFEYGAQQFSSCLESLLKVLLEGKYSRVKQLSFDGIDFMFASVELWDLKATMEYLKKLKSLEVISSSSKGMDIPLMNRIASLLDDVNKERATLGFQPIVLDPDIENLMGSFLPFLTNKKIETIGKMLETHLLRPQQEGGAAGAQEGGDAPSSKRARL